MLLVRKGTFMTRTVRIPVIIGALTIAFWSVTLGPLTSNQAMAQGIVVGRNPPPYYNSYGAGYNAYQNGYAGYGAANSGYSVYGTGPYVYGSSGVFGNSTPGVVYGASYGPDTSGVLYGGQTYPRAYAPSNVRYYSPYGYQSPYGLQNPYGYPSAYGYRRF
jgi:hypothetical protein